MDLIKKLADLEGVPCDPEPEAWYTNKFGQVPDYSKLLEGVAKTQAERGQLLKRYFEPGTQEEREQGLRMPTHAHRSMADLVASRHIRVIVTTNFDRLTETAVEATGIAPIIVASPDAAEGMPPLRQVPCVVIKVHGDYLDTRIRNSPAELATYDPRMDRLLDTVFDEFGLIVCGWSAEWDTALRGALERCKNRRFTTFWAARGPLSDPAKQLVALKSAEVISIGDADSFFVELQEKVTALVGIDAPHPLSAKIATATLKKYLVDERHRIALHDLLMSETQSLCDKISDRDFPLRVELTSDELLSRVNRYEASIELLRDLMITGCYWGETQHEYLWTRCQERVANRPTSHEGFADCLNLRRYPSLLLLYGGGIAAMAARNWGNLRAILVEPQILTVRRERRPLIQELVRHEVMSPKVAKRLPGMERQRTALSDWAFVRLREALKPFLPEGTDYEQCFERFECFFSLVEADLTDKEKGVAFGFPMIGRFAWKWSSLSGENPLLELEREATSGGEQWAPLSRGFFDGSVERFQTLINGLKQSVQKLNWC